MVVFLVFGGVVSGEGGPFGRVWVESRAFGGVFQGWGGWVLGCEAVVDVCDLAVEEGGEVVAEILGRGMSVASV